MWKFILLVVVAFGVWAYYNHFSFNNINVNDLQKNAVKMENNATNNVMNSVKGEKTIFKVNETRDQQNKETEKALNN